MESKAILFHSNKREKCEKFISEKDYLILSQNPKDDIWLGKGMYFWDNKGNATWWNKKQSRKKPDEIYSIIAANVNLDEMLDLTDYDIYVKIEEFWQGICNKAKKNPVKPLGNKLDILFDSYGFGSIYAIIKVYGKYNTTPNNGVFKFNYNSMNSEPTIGVKCIYSVRDIRCIIEKEFID